MDEHFRMILQRIDNYISATNTKGGMIVALNTFISGSILSQYGVLEPHIKASEFPSTINVLLLFLLTISIISVFLIGLAIFPYLKSGNSSKENYHSLIFFNSIAEYNNDTEYLDAAKNYSKEDSDDDLKRQIYVLSNALKRKFQYTGKAMFLFFANLLIMMLILILILS